jgi:hypothetical protein
MNAEPPQRHELEPETDRMPRIVWLLVALSPTILIMLIMGNGASHSGTTALKVVFFGVNPLLSFVGCYGLFNKSGASKAIPIVAGIFLGAFIAALNICIGFLVGCALSAKPFI